MITSVCNAHSLDFACIDTETTSSPQQALDFIKNSSPLKPSIFWPNVKPDLFLKNLQSVIVNPIGIYPGNGTNFCGYGALSYLFLRDHPLGFTKMLYQLYLEGKTVYNNVVYLPSAAVRMEAGNLKYKGILDIHPAEQIWYLTLAGHYKGYLNFFNRKYNPGDEDTFWASVNYAKFNRMANAILKYHLISRGSDLVRPRVGDLFKYVENQLLHGPVVLFINNRIVHKKNHVTIKLAVPTHFIVAEKISCENNLITLIYWDYGGKTLMQMSPSFFKRITYGITGFSKNATNEY